MRRAFRGAAQRPGRGADQHRAHARTQLARGGGGFFRLLPYALSRWQIARVNAADRRPAIFYFHPWEIDPEQPRVTAATAKTRFRHYINLQHTEARLDRLLSDFSWGRADEVFRDAA